MLTAESEGGQLKCHPYWLGRDYGQIKLRLISEKKISLEIDKHRSNSTATGSLASSASETGRRRANTTTNIGSINPSPQPIPSQGEIPHVIIRKFALSHASQPFAKIREITHLHYPSWPDFGAPAQPSHLLALVELANVMQKAAMPIETATIAASRSSPEPISMAWHDEPESDAKLRPMLVHCSAGCGRTGTFCTVDSVIDMLKRQRLAKTRNPVLARDSEGDATMSGYDEPVSPLTSKSKQGVFSPSSSFYNKKPNTGGGQVSRSNSLINLDLSWIQDDTIDLIEKTVEDFRGQRLSMVQSLRQYVLCYETILEWTWRSQERTGAGFRGRGRSGSLQVGREGSTTMTG
jgi:tyrosine-protein phosphatase 2/3